jgi:hypothetical protein
LNLPERFDPVCLCDNFDTHADALLKTPARLFRSTIVFASHFPKSPSGRFVVRYPALARPHYGRDRARRADAVLLDQFDARMMAG